MSSGEAKDIKTAAVKTLAKSQSTVIDMLMSGSMDSRLKEALESTGVDSKRFKNMMITTMRLNTRLQQCTPISVLGSMMAAAQLGLEVNTPLGHAYLIPYKQECTFQLGYKGLMELTRRSQYVSGVMAHAVYRGDEFAFQLGLSPNIHHLPLAEDREDPKNITHVYAYARFRDGSEPAFVVLTRAKVEQYRRRSRAGNDGPWVTDWEAMALKTAIKRLATWLPLSAQAAKAVAADGGVIHYNEAVRDTEVVLPEHESVIETSAEVYGTEGGAADEA